MKNEVNGLEGNQEFFETLEKFKEALVFIGRNNMNYFDSIDYVLSIYSNQNEELEKQNKFNHKMFLTLKGFSKIILFVSFFNIFAFFFISSNWIKIIFLISSISLFFINFIVFLAVKISLKN